MPMMHRILVIDDDPAVASWLKRGLAYEGYAVDIVGSGQGELAAGLCVPRRRIRVPSAPRPRPDLLDRPGAYSLSCAPSNGRLQAAYLKPGA